MNARRVAIGGGVFVLVAALGGVVAVSLGGRAERAAFGRQLARAAKLGLPYEMSALWPVPPDDGQNAAPLYASLTGSSAAFSRATEAAEKIGVPRTAKEAAEIDRILAGATVEMARTEAAAGLPTCRFVRVPSPDTLLPEYNPMRYGAKLLQARARREAYGPGGVKAMATLALAANIARQAGGEPLLAAKGVQTGIEDDVLRTAEQILARRGHDPKVRAAARRMLDALGPPPDYKDGFKGEWAMRWAIVRQYDDGRIGLIDLMKRAGYTTSDARFGKDRLQIGIAMASPVGHARMALEAADSFLDYYEAMPSDPAQVTKAREARATLEARQTAAGVDGFLSRIETPFVLFAADGGGQAVARRRSFAALLAALDRPVPPTLLPVAGDAAIDPFSDKPLRYRSDRKGIRVWSVGPDGKDDGGDRKRDIVFAFPDR